jgi:hypothetical protein
MEIRQDSGLRFALLTAEEAVDADPASTPPDVTLLRVPDPPAESWPRLAALGYVRKPAWISWISEVCESEEAWLGRLAPSHARAILKARRRLEHDIRIGYEQPVPEHLLDEFLLLYRDMIARLPNGVPYAVSQRDEILENDDNFIVFARSPEGMEGACICRVSAEDNMVVMRFPAYSPRARADSLSRVLYMEVLRVARERGCGHWSLGKDPNIYGHVTRAGLFDFKARRLGFTPQATIPPFGLVPWRDEADLVVSSRGLDEPTLMLGYADVAPAPGDRPAFVLDVFCAPEHVGSQDSMGRLPFVGRVRYHALDFGQR